MKPKLLITRALNPETLQSLYNTYQVDVWESESDAMPREQLLERSRGSAGILCMLTDRIDSEVLDAAGPQLQVVSSMSAGLDHIDTKLLDGRGVAYHNTPGVLDASVADLTVCLMLNTARRVSEAEQAARNGEWGSWSPYWLTGYDLSSATVGIVGMGEIGAAVAKRLAGFGCNVLYSSRSRKPQLEVSLGVTHSELPELLATSDFVTVHTALTPETKHMCDRDFFARMKPTAVFINTSRGDVVNQTDLVEALKSGTIYAAGLDVTTPEPLPTGHPLFSLKNCIILPHIGSASIKTRNTMAEHAVNNLLKTLSNVV